MSSIPQYLDRLRYVRMDLIPDLFAVEHPRDSESSYFIATYDNYQNRKIRLFNLMARMGQTEFKKKWDGHHIVEGNHLRSFFTTDQEYKKFYNTMWPVVYIHNEEHRMYNSLFRSKETAMLHDMSRLVAKKERLENVRELYLKCYDGNPVLTTISKNVLQEIKNLLPRLV